MPYTSQAQAGYFHTHRAQLEKEGVDVDEWDRKTKGKKLPKRAKDVNGMVPGDCPGSASVLSARLDRLIQFDDAALFKRMRELGMGHQIRGLTGGAAEHVSAPSAQASRASVSHAQTDYSKLPFKVVSPDTINIPPQPVMKNEERLSLLNRLDGIRRRNAVRQAAVRQQQLRSRPSSWYPGRSSESFSARLDRLIQFNDPRPRNSLGEYSQQQEGVADPNSMAKTYNNPNSNTGIAKTAIIGGAAGTVGAGATKGVGEAIKALYSKLHVKK